MQLIEIRRPSKPMSEAAGSQSEDFRKLFGATSVMGSLTQFSARAFIVALGLATGSAWAADDIAHLESQQEYWAQFDRRDWDAAVTAAQGLVAQARKSSAEKPLELAEALSLLGNAQLGKKDYPAAEAAYGEGLKLVEQHAGRTSAHLVDPLRGLGYALAAENRHAEAVPYLDRALLIAHRSYGLFDIHQQGMLRQLAASLTRLGRPEEAERHMKYLMRLGEHTYGARDPRMASVLCIVGDWYADVGTFQIAREKYRQAIEVVEKRLGKNDPALVAPLRALANGYTQELLYSTMGLQTDRGRIPTDADGSSNDHEIMNPRYLDSEGEKSLQRALAILQSHPDSSRETLVETLIQTGDWFQLKDDIEDALPYYRRAATLTPTASPKGQPAPQPLSFPVRVYYPMPPLATRNRTLPDDQVSQRFVRVEFTVTREGDVRDARVVERDGTEREAAQTLQAIRAARFRPKFVGGEPVETPGMTLREVFRLRKPEQPDGS